MPLTINELSDELKKTWAEHPDRAMWEAEAKKPENQEAGLRYAALFDHAETEAKEILYLVEHGGLNDFYTMEPVSGLTLLTVCSMISDESKAKAIEKLNSIRGQTASQGRKEKYKTTEEDLKQYWHENIAPDKKATDAAILLEGTDICKSATPRPLRRSTLETYVRRWQKETQALPK